MKRERIPSIRIMRKAHWLAIIATVALTACTASPDQATTAAAGRPLPQGVDDPTGSCTLVTGGEMSAILGQVVVGIQRALDGGHSNCDYYSVDGHRRVFTLILERDSLDTARSSVDAPLHHGPATADRPYAEIGDEAGQAFDGRMLVVVVGNDLLNFDLTQMKGDKHATIKQIVDAAAPRLRQ